jgi:hypothetical protein
VILLIYHTTKRTTKKIDNNSKTHETRPYQTAHAPAPEGRALLARGGAGHFVERGHLAFLLLVF